MPPVRIRECALFGSRCSIRPIRGVRIALCELFPPPAKTHHPRTPTLLFVCLMANERQAVTPLYLPNSILPPALARIEVFDPPVSRHSFRSMRDTRIALCEIIDPPDARSSHRSMRVSRSTHQNTRLRASFFVFPSGLPFGDIDHKVRNRFSRLAFVLPRFFFCALTGGGKGGAVACLRNHVFDVGKMFFF